MRRLNLQLPISVKAAPASYEAFRQPGILDRLQQAARKCSRL